MDERATGFGPELRRRRLAAGLSLGELARRLHYSKSHLSKIENGAKEPGSDLARRCDSALDAGGALAALVPRRERADATVPSSTGHGVWAMSLDAAGRGEFGSVDRRGLLMAGVATLVGWAVAPTPAPKRCDRDVLVAFRAMLDQTRRLGQATSPAALLPTVAAQAHTLRVLAADAPPGVREQAFVLAARFAEYAGWMAQEAGSNSGALWWTDQAVRLAEHGDDHELAGYALVRRALVCLYEDDATATVTLAQGAQSGRMRPRIRGLAAQREAQGYAIAGEYDKCRRALDRAAALLSQPDDREEPILGTSTLDDPVAMTTGWCLFDLGRPAEAAAVLERQLQRIPPDARRARARYEARYGLALAALGEVERACSVAETVLDALTYIDSATVRIELRHLMRQLNRWHSAEPVRRLMPALVAGLGTTAVR